MSRRNGVLRAGLAPARRLSSIGGICFAICLSSCSWPRGDAELSFSAPGVTSHDRLARESASASSTWRRYRRRFRVRRAAHESETRPGSQTDDALPFFVQFGWMSEGDWRSSRRSLRTLVWKNRRAVADVALSGAPWIAKLRAPFYIDGAEQEARGEEPTEAQPESNPIATVAFVAVFAIVLLRIGGRSAFLAVLGLDVLQDSEVLNGINQMLEFTNAVGFGEKLAFILAAWVVAKVLMLDFLVFLLAVVNGVIFGGVLEGTLVSCLCATIGSSVAFFFSRSVLYEKTRARLDTSPGLRAIEKAVAEEGAKAVFTLRLAPILPIPIGAYAYIYGLTRLNWQDFALGTFVGSAKVYFLDAYLGSIFKGASSLPNASDPTNDAFLLFIFVATVSAGSFASELAVKSFAELTSEIEAYQTSVVEKRQLPSDDPGNVDPLLRNQGLLESLAFWGIQASDFPGPLASFFLTLDAAQARMRGLYAVQWSAKQREVQDGEMQSETTGASESSTPDELRKLQPLRETQQPTEAVTGASPTAAWEELRPETVEAREGWTPDYGSEAAQALLVVPVFVEALGAYSKPELWPAILKQAEKDRAAV